MQDLLQIQQQTIDAVKKAAVFIQSEIGKINNNDIETKALNSLVTYVDKNSEIILVEELRKKIPNATFLSEDWKFFPISEFNFIVTFLPLAMPLKFKISNAPFS